MKEAEQIGAGFEPLTEQEVGGLSIAFGISPETLISLPAETFSNITTVFRQIKAQAAADLFIRSHKVQE